MDSHGTITFHSGYEDYLLREFVNCRHPDPRRGEPRACFTQLDAFPVDPVDPVQNSGTLILKHPSDSFGTFGRKLGIHVKANLLKKTVENLYFRLQPVKT